MLLSLLLGTASRPSCSLAAGHHSGLRSHFHGVFSPRVSVSKIALPSSHKDTKHSIKGTPRSDVTLSRPICKDPIFK